MKCPICNEEVSNTEQAKRWGPEFAHARCVTAYNHGKSDAAHKVPAQWQEAMKVAREALVEAKESVATWGSYASEYFQDKHNLDGDLRNIDAALAQLDSLGIGGKEQG